MQDILEQLNQVAGVKGSMVVTKDGVVVSEALGPDLDTVTVAAVSSHMIQVAGQGLGLLDRGMFERFTLTSARSTCASPVVKAMPLARKPNSGMIASRMMRLRTESADTRQLIFMKSRSPAQRAPARPGHL